MATRQQEDVTAADVLASVQGLAPAIAERAGEVEAGRRVPRDLLDQLAAAGCIRLLLPASHGGIGADLPGALRVFEAVSTADASVGWVVALGASAWREVAGVPRPTFDALYADGPDTPIAGVFNPSGSVVSAAGGYRVRGRWSFASGCEHADWLYVNCLEQGAPPPGMRVALFRRDEVAIEDTWDALGLRGTGSHHLRVDDVVVPGDRTCATLVSAPCVEAAVLRIPPPAHFALGIACVALGTARGALDDVLALAAGRVPLLAHAPLAADPVFHRDLGTAETALAAARSLLYDEAGRVWHDAVEDVAITDDRRARVRAAAAWATEQAAAVVTTAHRAAGSAGVYEGAPLPRRLRDVSTITQHFLVKPATMATAGALLAGQPIDVPVF
jgi:indole-3-acetate monooxygenase